MDVSCYIGTLREGREGEEEEDCYDVNNEQTHTNYCLTNFTFTSIDVLGQNMVSGTFST